MPELFPKKPGITSSPTIDPLVHLNADGQKRDVLDALSLMIERAGLGIGDRLPPEVEIAKKLNVGRSKVREALIAWQNMGIVTRNKKAGTRLAAEVSSKSLHMPVTLKLEAESLLRTHAVRRPLEIEAVRLAARHVTAQQSKIILARSAELMAVYEAGENWRAADHRFHKAIHDACGNPLFEQLIRQIQDGFNAIYEAPFGQPHLGQATIPLHPGIADAIADGDEKQAVAIMGTIMDIVETEVRHMMGDQNV
ncbi:HTH-type transcriptional repressor NanR [Roseobacter fucihabitans]|uniref:HTH-type transcriptional repressor NanR n=1 Tax=Roseobacter fucihabitans TaxID=1537242 RepID=A0ABZ2BZI6_9RHOB|nr:FCD domain-containing protein [Roseobacter litoralis]MBC6968152.1 HTH-type transcriptional regulator LutR [Roseobacter litoralis]